MKKTIISFLFISFCLTSLAQDEVTFSFSYKMKRNYARTIVTLYINGTEAMKLPNGASLVYKSTLDVSQPVTVLAKIGLNSQEITFMLSPGNKCSLETGFLGGMLYLDLLSGGKLAPGTGSRSRLSANKKDLSISYTSETVNATDTIRLQWLEKGGRIKSTSYVGGATFLSMSESGLKMTGIGGQFVMSYRLLNFKIPEYKPGIRKWSSLVLGFSETYQLYGSTSKIEIEGMDPITSSSFTGSIMISPDLGFTLGLGKFKTQTKWKGVAFELTYRPSVIMSETIVEETESYDANINWTGFSFDVNFNSFTSTAAKLAPRAQSKFSFFLLPPVKKMPLFITVGYGLQFYTRRK